MEVREGLGGSGILKQSRPGHLIEHRTLNRDHRIDCKRQIATLKECQPFLLYFAWFYEEFSDHTQVNPYSKSKKWWITNDCLNTDWKGDGQISTKSGSVDISPAMCYIYNNMHIWNDTSSWIITVHKITIFRKKTLLKNNPF